MSKKIPEKWYEDISAACIMNVFTEVSEMEKEVVNLRPGNIMKRTLQ